MVKLLFITPDYAKTIEYAARTSTATECKENSEDFVRKLVKKGHLSVGRHCNASFEVTCSRSCLQQFVRSKFLEFTVESQRYVDYSEKPFVMPDLGYIKNETERFNAVEGIEELVMESRRLYKLLIKSGVKKEDARAILPGNMETRFVVTSNLQGWTDFINLRTNKHAQEEIRQIAEQIRDILIQEAPAFFEGLKGE